MLSDHVTTRAHRRHFLIQARLIIQFNFSYINTLLYHLNSCLVLRRERRRKLQKILCTAGTDGIKYYQQERADSAAVFRPLWTQPAYIQLQLREQSGSLIRKGLWIWPQLSVNINSPVIVFQSGPGQTLPNEHPLVQKVFNLRKVKT